MAANNNSELHPLELTIPEDPSSSNNNADLEEHIDDETMEQFFRTFEDMAACHRAHRPNRLERPASLISKIIIYESYCIPTNIIVSEIEKSPNLVTLKLTGIEAFDCNDLIRSAVASCPNLEVLIMIHCFVSDPDVVEQMKDFCPKLRVCAFNDTVIGGISSNDLSSDSNDDWVTFIRNHTIIGNREAATPAGPLAAPDSVPGSSQMPQFVPVHQISHRMNGIRAPPYGLPREPIQSWNDRILNDYNHNLHGREAVAGPRAVHSCQEPPPRPPTHDSAHSLLTSRMLFNQFMTSVRRDPTMMIEDMDIPLELIDDTSDDSDTTDEE